MSARESIERQFLESLILAPNLISKAKELFNVQDLQNPTYAKLGEILYTSTSLDVSEMIENCDPKSRSLISQVLLERQKEILTILEEDQKELLLLPNKLQRTFF